MKKLAQAIKKVEKQAWDLDLIRDIPLLDTKKTEQLAEIKQDLVASFKKREVFRPKYLMEVSVLKDFKFPTPDAKYWQCVLERDVMFQNLLSLSFDFKEKQADIDIKEAQIKELKEKGDPKSLAMIEKLKVQIQRSLFQMAIMQKEAQDRHREIMAWTELIGELRPQLRYSPDDPEEHLPESILLRSARQKLMIQQLGAQDMNGAMNILGLGETAARYWKDHDPLNKFLKD